MRFDIPSKNPNKKKRRKKLLELYKLERRYKHAKKMKSKVYFRDDILKIKKEEMSLISLGFECFMIKPSSMSVTGRVAGEGFDVFITGKFNKSDNKLDMIACYAKVGRIRRQYSRVDLRILSDSNPAEASITLRYFESNWLRKKFHYRIVNKE